MHSLHPANSRSANEGVIADLVEQRRGQEWCLFLDRDGVINRQIVGDYVRAWRDFEWLPEARTALTVLSRWACHLVIVTNQQGIGKGLMTRQNVDDIHENIQADLAAQKITLDGFQVCPHLASEVCVCRKPRPGLVLDWLAQNRSVEPTLSVVVGDSESDIQLARNVATAVGSCASIQIGGRGFSNISADASFDTLWDFARTVNSAMGGCKL